MKFSHFTLFLPTKSLLRIGPSIILPANPTETCWSPLPLVHHTFSLSIPPNCPITGCHCMPYQELFQLQTFLLSFIMFQPITINPRPMFPLKALINRILGNGRLILRLKIQRSWSLWNSHSIRVPLYIFHETSNENPTCLKFYHIRIHTSS